MLNLRKKNNIAIPKVGQKEYTNSCLPQLNKVEIVLYDICLQVSPASILASIPKTPVIYSSFSLGRLFG